MRQLSCFQIGQEDSRRFVNAVPAEQPASPLSTAQSSPLEEDSEISKFREEAATLLPDVIVSDLGHDLSLEKIIDNLAEIKRLRQEGKTAELKEKVLKHYGGNPAYVAYMTARTGAVEVTKDVIDKIQKDELLRFKSLCGDAAKTEYDHITRGAAPPDFSTALSAIRSGSVHTGEVGKEVKKTLNKMKISTSSNSAVEYLKKLREKERFEEELQRKKTELHSYEAEKNLQEEKFAKINHKKEDWKVNGRWKWMPTIAKATLGFIGIASAGLGVWGLGSGFYHGKGFGDALSGLGSGLWKFPSFLFSLATFQTGGAVLTGVASAAALYHFAFPRHGVSQASQWNQVRMKRNVLEKERKARHIDELEQKIKEANSVLEGYRKQNLDSQNLLSAHLDKLEAALKEENITHSQQDELEKNIAHLKTLITLFRISEGDSEGKYGSDGKRIIKDSGGAVTADYIVKNLRDMGIDEQDDMFVPLKELSAREDKRATMDPQEKLKNIAESGAVEKEISKLTRKERIRINNFLKNPTTGSYNAIHFTLLSRKAPRLADSIRSLNALSAENVWKKKLSTALLRTMDDQMERETKPLREKIFKRLSPEIKVPLESFIQRHPECLNPILQSFNNNAPQATAGASLEDFLSELDMDGLKKVIRALDVIDDPNNPYVVKEDGSGLEHEKAQLRTKITGLITYGLDAIVGVADARNALNNSNSYIAVALLNSVPWDASGNTVPDEYRITSLAPGNTFLDKITAEKNIETLRNVKIILERVVGGCKFDNGKFVVK